ARFVGEGVDGATAAAAREQLSLAARLRSADWTLEAGRGLVIQEHTRIPLGPYGSGSLRIRVAVSSPDGFQMLVRDGIELPKHQHFWRVQQGYLQQYFREDERPGQLLAEDRVDRQVSIDV